MCVWGGSVGVCENARVFVCVSVCIQEMIQYLSVVLTPDLYVTS